MITKIFAVLLLALASLAGARADLWRPCESDCNDKETLNACITQYFVDNSDCCPDVPGVVPFPFVYPYIQIRAPILNLTDDRYNNKVTSDCTWVEDFYVDLDTDNLYLIVNFDNVTEEGENHYTYYRPGQPDKTFVSKTHERYPNIKVTTRIPCSQNLEFGERQVRAYVSAIPEFDVGNGFKKAAKKDPVIRKLLKAVLENSVTPPVQEVFFDRAPIFGDLYINNVVCKIK